MAETREGGGSRHGDASGEAPARVSEKDLADVEELAEIERLETQRLPLFFRVVDMIFKVVLAVMLLVLVVTVGANVGGRFLFAYSLTWADELSRFTFIWVIFLGAALAHFHDEHIAVDYVVERFPPFVAKVVAVLRELVILGVLGIILWGAWELLATRPGTSPLLGIPMNWVNASVPLGASLMVLMSAFRLAKTLPQLRQKES